MNEIIFAFWFLLPAGLANGTPPIVNKIPYLNKINYPLDFGLKIKNQRVLGDNKKWRGLIMGIFTGAATGFLQYFIYPEFVDNLGIATNHPLSFLVILGGLLGFGALAGDALESFFKRRIGIKPGSSWFPFDQIDYILGAFIAASPLVVLDYKQYLLAAILWWAIHVISTYIGYLFGLRDKPI